MKIEINEIFKTIDRYLEQYEKEINRTTTINTRIYNEINGAKYLKAFLEGYYKRETKNENFD